MLTAHPTEVNRRSLLVKHHQLQESLADLHSASTSIPELSAPGSSLSSYERKQHLREIRRLVHELWASREVRDSKPTPQEEAMSGMYVVESSLWEAVPMLMRRIDHVLEHVVDGTTDDLGPEKRPVLPPSSSIVRIGSWMGGDRDGNPNVTPTVTHEISLSGRWMALAQIKRDIAKLRLALCMGDAPSVVNHLAQRLASGDGAAAAVDAALASESALQSPAGTEPYREVLRQLEERVDHTFQVVEVLLEALRSGENVEFSPFATGADPLLVAETSDLLGPLQVLCVCTACSRRYADAIRALTPVAMCLVGQIRCFA